MSDSTASPVVLRMAALEDLITRALQNAGARAGMARSAARVLVTTESLGVPSHGVARVPFYCSMLRNGRADGCAVPKPLREHEAVYLLDNADALVFEACEIAVKEAIIRAEKYGIGVGAVTNGGHAGALGVYLMPVAEAGLVGIATCNGPAAIPPWGGKRALYNTSPIAACLPRAHGKPLAIDLSITTVARGRIMLAAQRGEAIPEGWALDREGRPTTDPHEVLTGGGTLFPIGGMKGSMLALMVEALCACLTGSAIGPEMDSYFSEQGNRPRSGHLFLVLSPAAFAGAEKFHDRLERIITLMLAENGVRLPGARRHAGRAAALRDGVALPAALYEELRKLAGYEREAGA